MTPDIERLAKEAGFIGRAINRELLAKFAALVAEECANIARMTYEGSDSGGEYDSGFTFYGENSADAIRAKFALSNEAQADK